MRKVLSFVLVLSLVLGSFSMAFAADSSAGLTDVAGNANADAIQVAYDLGIITGNPDGTFQPDKAVNRAEFAAMITRALAIPDSALAGYTSTTFKDTAGYGWAVPYLAFCQSKGIMLGDGAGNVMPGRTITVNEAITMALRAIGYTQNSALLVGAWPANYVSIAQNEDLYDDVASDTTVNKASAAQIIYNLLTVQKVAVNADGDTNFLWTNKANTIPATLLTTNLGATEEEGVIIGDDYTYDTSVINITGKIGAYGTAYENDDEELIAFDAKSTALTGKVDGDKFKVGDVKYEFDVEVTSLAAVFLNTVKGTATLIDEASDITASIAGDGDVLTLNVDLSGKKIKQVYSAVAWEATEAELAPSDVQEDIADNELSGYDFVENDDDEIDMASFQLVGVDSLEDIDEDNVVYVYTDGTSDNNIRKVAVGTETVEGVVDETNETDKVTINDKEYSLAKLVNGGVVPIKDIEFAEGTFYLDYEGKIFDFDGTSGKADTYAVVKAYNWTEDGFNNAKLKLYLSDDSSDTYYLADKAAKIDWVPTVAALTPSNYVTAGSLIGYSLDKDGDLDTIDASATTPAIATFSSMKVLKTGVRDYSIASDAVVFTKDGTDYDIASLSEVEKGTLTAGAQFLLDGTKVVAMLVDINDVDVDEDAYYGVINSKITRQDEDDNTIYKLGGLIDGESFSYLTEEDNNPGTADQGYALNKIFGLYKITVDANNIITKIDKLTDAYDPDTASGIVAAGTIDTDGLNSDKTVITIGGKKFTASDDAVVYKFADDKYTVAKITNLRDGYTVMMYDTKGDEADGVATVVIYKEK